MPSPGRTNVLGWIRGGKNVIIVCESHLDTVPELNELCTFDIRGGKICGRGACDTKASGAAMITAMQTLAQNVPFDYRPTMVFAGVIDEEAMMTGAIALLPILASADMVIVGESTELLPLRAHSGILRFNVTVIGETAHSAIANAGINAIGYASQIIFNFEQYRTLLLKHAFHQLTGQGTFTLTHITGGVATNDEVCARFRGEAVVASVAMFCTDASVFSGESDIPCIILGRGSIAQAHVPGE